MKYQGFCAKYGEGRMFLTAIFISAASNPIVSNLLTSEFISSSNSTAENIVNLSISAGIGSGAGAIGYGAGADAHSKLIKTLSCGAEKGSNIVKLAQGSAYAFLVSIGIVCNMSSLEDDKIKFTPPPQGSPFVHLDQQRQAVIRRVQPL